MGCCVCCWGCCVVGCWFELDLALSINEIDERSFNARLSFVASSVSRSNKFSSFEIVLCWSIKEEATRRRAVSVSFSPIE